MNKLSPLPPRRETALIPVIEMVEVELPTPEEKAELIASLEEGERDIKAGKFVLYKDGDMLAGYLAHRASMTS